MSLSDHSAPGSNAGFSFQFERALYYLSQCSAGSVVGIETDDDVAVRGQDSTQILEQDKHSIQKDGEPFGDRSKDLWNTLAIWLEALDASEVMGGTTLFLMVTNKTLPDCVARKLAEAKSEEEIDESIAALERVCVDPPKGIQLKVERVMRPASRKNLRKLIARCRLADGAQDAAGEGLRAKTIGHLQLPDWCAASAGSIVDELLGWMHRTALTSWQEQQPAWIRREHFVNQLHAIIDLRKRKISRERAAHLIPIGDDKIGKEKGSRFVKQLHLITEDDNVVDTSIREFIRCNIEKLRLSAEGNITDDDWLAFESTLFARWEKIRARIVRMQQGESEENIGFSIFTDTSESHCEKLAGSETEQVYLTAGTYHRLADMLRVGWHPRFEELMRENLKS